MPLVVRQPGVIRRARASRSPASHGGERVDVPARRAVDDARLAAMPLENVEDLRLSSDRASTR